MDYKEKYLSVIKKYENVIECSLVDENLKLHANASCFLEDMYTVLNSIHEFYAKEIYYEALENYKYFLLFWGMGAYKHAYTMLRSYYELFMFGIYMSTDEYQFRLWKSGERDLYWAEIVDVDKGLFSRNYVKMFCPELIDYVDAYRNLACLSYRECSEFIHNNYKTFGFDSDIKFNNTIYNNINEKLMTINKVISYCFFIRHWDTYKNIVNKSIVDDLFVDQLQEIKQIHILLCDSI